MSNKKSYNRPQPMIQNSSIIKYANEKNVTLAEISEKLGIKDTDFSLMLRNHLGYHKEQEIKAIVDGIVNARNEDASPESIEELKFVGISRRGTMTPRSTSDVSVSAGLSCDSDRHFVHFAFRNDVWVALGERIEFAFTKKRVYFKESPNGYKITSDSNNKDIKRTKFGVDEETYNIILENAGGYGIKRDERLGLLYIDFSEKE